MDPVSLVAPVTALEFLQEAFLLTGEGPVLSVYRLQSCSKACTSLSVLQHYRIHGIRPRSQETLPPQSSATAFHRKKKCELSKTTEPKFCDLVVFGGKAVRLVKLHVEDEEHFHLEVLGPLVELKDWALDVRWLPGDKQSLLCVALAHNSALLLNVTTGNALVQRSCLEGCLLYSALLLVHESWLDAVIVGGTVFNQLVLWKPGGEDKSSDSENKAPIERRLLGHTGVIFSISYLQEKGFLASASDDRSVRVWGVGALGGREGKCGDLNPVCLNILYGHQARVFSVHLSSGNVFSAGEDGTCLVWDLAGGGKVVRMLKGHRAGGVRALAVSEGDEQTWVATGGADGGVRLWRVEGSKEKKNNIEEEALKEKLNDLKFPGHGLPKVVCIAGEEDENANWSQKKFVVCTDKGIVYQYCDGKWEVVWTGTSEFQSYCVMDTITVSVKESTAKVDLCAVGNLSGCLQVFSTSHPHSGSLLMAGSGKIHSLIWHKGKECVYLLASGAEGLVYRWCVETKLNETHSVALSIIPLPSFLLPPCAKRWLTAAVRLQSRSQGVLWVCGDRRGSLLLFQEREKSKHSKGEDGDTNEGLLMGRRQADDEKCKAEGNGSSGDGKCRMIESKESKGVLDPLLHPMSCLFGVHGKQGVTSVYEYHGLFYSTGRDGCVRVFRVHSTPPKKLEVCRKNGASEKSEEIKEGLQLEVLRVQRACKGMEWLERILILEPEKLMEDKKVKEDCEELYDKEQHNLTEKLELGGEEKEEETFKEVEKEGREARFVIVGFHAVHFVVWDPVMQERLLAVPCGGGHRSWSLWPSHKGIWPGYGALVYIKQGAVLASHPPGEPLGHGGKAGGTGGISLKEGVHGRGIGCVCRLGRIWDLRNENQTRNYETEGDEVEREERHWELVVTGGEDTSLTVLALHPFSGSIKVLSVITDHISSIRTVTGITGPEGGSEYQSKSLSALLVSAGGRAQIQCYRLLIAWDRQRLAPSCQVIQVASHRLDRQWERRRNRHKMVKMDPETRYMSITVVDEKVNRVLLALSCSDGAVRLFSVNEGKGEIELLWETFYHQRCVLSVAACSLEDDKGNRYKLLFSAATDGKIAVWNLTDCLSFSMDNSSSAPAPSIPCLDVPAHQSGINSLAVWAEKQGQQKGSCLVTVASGGDDGQLTVSTIRVQHPEDGKIGSHMRFSQISESQNFLQTQLQCPNKLQIHFDSQCHIPFAHAAPLTALKVLRTDLVVSTSSDQRVCLWKVCGNNISHTGALCSHIADAAGLAAWEGEEGNEQKKTGFESEQETAKGKTGGKLKRDEETADETNSEAPVVTKSETGDLVSKTAGEKEEKSTVNKRNQMGNDSVGKTVSEVSPETGLKEEREGKKEGWVLVCGQGFQLLRVRNTETCRDVDKEKGKKRKN